MELHRQFAKKLLIWFDQHGRKNLPWQQQITPYRVWISEIMLQQTQVATVILYFERFIQQFPDVQTLAQASEDEVLHLWTGLGYYARARNLYSAANIITQQFHGKFPDQLEELQTLPGIGRSTAGAILSIAMGKQTAILDGNVKRVFTRLYAIEGWPGTTKILARLWHLAEQHTPKIRTGDYTQAIMDLGATLCLRSKPLCSSCPFTSMCQAHQQNRTHEFPYKNPNTKQLPIQHTRMLLLYDSHDAILLQKRPPVGIWGGLWSFPECNMDENLILWCQQKLGIKAKTIKEWPSFRHTFSHFHLEITPIEMEVEQQQITIMDVTNQAWYKIGDKPLGGLSSPVKRLLTQLQRTKTRVNS